MTREEKRREKLIKHLKYNRSIGADYMITDEDVDEIIKALEQESVLDKIRAEIDSHCSDNRDRNDGLYIAMKIIDKYRESENKEIHSVIDGDFFKGI